MCWFRKHGNLAILASVPSLRSDRHLLLQVYSWNISSISIRRERIQKARFDRARFRCRHFRQAWWLFERSAFNELIATRMGALPRIVATTHANTRAAMDGAICGAELPMDDIVENRLEVVKENGVRGAFEHESEAPVWIDATAGCDTSGGDGGICEKEGYREKLVTISVWLLVNEV